MQGKSSLEDILADPEATAAAATAMPGYRPLVSPAGALHNDQWKREGHSHQP